MKENKMYFRVNDVFNAVDSFEMLGVRSEADEIHKLIADTMRRILYGLEMVPALEADEIEEQADKIQQLTEQVKNLTDKLEKCREENNALLTENDMLKVLPEIPVREHPENKSGRGILARIREGRRTK